MLIDSHCHLDLINPEAGQIDKIIKAAVSGGVSKMLCVSVSGENVGKVREIAAQYPGVVYATAGIHPNSVDDEPIRREELLVWADYPEVVAIGETGLDYFRSENRLVQQSAFRTHIRVALQLKKPLVIHMRDAGDDCIHILREEGAERIGGVMHCFVENWETAQRAMDLGFFISFSGIVTFKSAVELQEVAKRVPLERLLVETDSPWLAPVPYRGKTNQPLWVNQVAAFIADLRGESLEKISELTSDNFCRLFKIDRSDNLQPGLVAQSR